MPYEYICKPDTEHVRIWLKKTKVIKLNEFNARNTLYIIFKISSFVFSFKKIPILTKQKSYVVDIPISVMCRCTF